MRYARRSTVAVAVVFVAVTGTQAADGAEDAYDRPGRNEMVSVSSAGKQMRYPPTPFGANNEFADITPGGRYVVFATNATGLAPGDVAGPAASGYRVYERDRLRRRTVQASVAADGSQQLPPGPLSDALWPTVSADGRYVAFQSDAINLVPGDTNNASDVFVKDLRTGRVKRVSVSSQGEQSNRGGGNQSISADGRYVAFASASDNLISARTNGSNVFRHDLKTGKTVLVSANLRGKPANNWSEHPSISADGRYVAFDSSARDLVRNDTTGVECDCPAPNVFRRDLKTGKTVRVSVASDGSQASFAALPSCTVGTPPLITLPPGSPIEQIGGPKFNICGSGTWSSRRAISSDGRYILFGSNASNLVPNDTNGKGTHGGDQFVHDVKTGRTERVSVDSSGHERNGIGIPYVGGISANGRYVHYTQYTVDAASPDPQDPVEGISDPFRYLLGGAGALATKWETFVYDRAGGAMDQTSRPMSGKASRFGPCAGGVEAINPSPMTWAGAISADGRYAVMRSNVTNLTSKDTNNGCDFFVRDRASAVGVGGFGGAGTGSGAGSSDDTCLNDGICVPPLALTSSEETTGDVRDAAADLVGAHAVYRPGIRDLFVRLDVARMPSVGGAPAGGLLYGLRFTAGDQRYEVRVQRVPGVDFDPKGGASFGLFRQDALTGLWTKVAALKGGYGTTGHSVVAAVPLSELGLRSGGRLGDVQAFTGIGDYLTGVQKVIDTVRLRSE